MGGHLLYLTFESEVALSNFWIGSGRELSNFAHG